MNPAGSLSVCGGLVDFDAPVIRRGSGCAKWDVVEEGVIPLWVADMDFAAPPGLSEVFAERSAHPYYGYNLRSPGYTEAIASWYRERHGIVLDTDEILPCTGTVISLGTAVRTYTQSGDGVLVMTPVYTPFYRVIRENGRRVVEAPMSLDAQGRFIFDEAALERAVDQASAAGIAVPLAFFCSPHNPGGRVWTGAEITSFLDFAERRGMFVAADEIHCDFVYAPNRFVSTASFDKYAGRTIVLSAATKTFNLGGFHVSHSIIRDKKLRNNFNAALKSISHREPDVFAERAVETCYRYCAPWLDALKSYLGKNLEAASAFLNAISGITTWTPCGTYLLWADTRGIIERKRIADDVELVKRLEKEAKVKITHGRLYGKAGAGFVRINAASPRSLLMEALERIKTWAAR